MSGAAVRLSILVALATSTAAAQTPPGEETQVLTFAVTAPPPLGAPSVAASEATTPRGSWVVSETRSPVDYAPVAIATSVAATDEAPRLSIQCRGGQTDLLVLLPMAPTGRETVSLAVDEEPPRVLRVAPSATQTGVVLRDAPQHLLAGLPPRGTLRLRVATAAGPETESRIELPILATVLDRLAGPCDWPRRPK